jgi:ribosomal protein L37E
MIEPTESDIGRLVIYRDSGGKVESGVITSFTEHWVYVRYGIGLTGAPTSRHDLTWAVQPHDETPYVCPDCGRRSWHPQDKLHRFCSVCGFEDERDLRRQLSRQSSQKSPGSRVG